MCWCQDKSGDMGAEDGGVLVPNQFTTVNVSKTIWLDSWRFPLYWIKKKKIPAQMFLSGHKRAESHAVTLPVTQL